MNKKITKIIKEEIENFEKEDSIEMPEKTDPTKGVVAPSKKVLSDVCEKEKFCKKQGPITFGQLRSLVESAQRKNLIFDVGEGGYKATLRLLPWFFPQIAVAGFIGSSVRAFNKIIRPGLEDTRGYKRWWGKTIIKVMDVFEGDIPRQDPISKIFFISDGLLHMMDKKFKLKFARYIAELAASKPDSEPVPEYFVENELRKWINQKFLLNPPLQPKTVNENNQYLKEIRRTTSLIGGKINYNEFIDWAKSEADKITDKKESFSGLEFQWSENDGNVKVIVYENDTPLGYIGLEKFEDGYKINTLGVKDFARGKGLATKMYDYIISKTKLYSDKMQTPEARKLWVKLASKYNVSGYNRESKKLFNVDILDNELKSSDKNYELYSNKKNDNYLVVNENFLDGKIMNESNDDFDWIRETRPVSYEFLIGKALEFEPTIKDGDTLMSILNFLNNLGFEYGDWYLDMEWNYGEYTEIFGLYLNPNGRIIYTTDLWGESYQYHINGYAETDVEVLDGWDTLSDYINRGTITESEDDTWNWVRDIEVKTHLTPAQIYNRYQTLPVEVVGPYIAGQFRDIEYRGGKLYFITDGWCDLVRLFEDNDGGYNYMNRYLAKNIFCDDDYWEPYSSHDLIGREWKSTVWDLVTDDPKALEYIKKYIREGGFIDGELENGEPFREDMLLDDDLIGDLINEDDMFDELKRELGWAYASSYNNAVSNNIYNTATDSIIDLLGKPTWEASNLVFESTDLILDVIKNRISECFDGCKKYYDPEKHYDTTEHEDEIEAFESFCEECIDKPFDQYSWFVDEFVEFLEENDDELTPRYDDYATNSEMKEYFLEDLYGRI